VIDAILIDMMEEYRRCKKRNTSGRWDRGCWLVMKLRGTRSKVKEN